MLEAYKQIHIKPEDVPKTAFSTIFSTFMSWVMQQGDCNAPSTFRRLMTVAFHDYIAQFVHAYLDNIFIYSLSVEEHKAHLMLVFDRLCEAQLYLSWDNVDLYLTKMDCLGHITNAGIHADVDKMQKIRDWRQPHSYHEIQQFLGLVQYLAHFMPDITAYTLLLAGCVRNNKLFSWPPLLHKCFESIKALACHMPILKLINANNPDPIWVICDGSKSGVGSIYGQGPEWQTCCPTGFLSKRFSAA